VAAFAGAEQAPPVGGELRLLHPGPAPAGALGPVIGFPLRHTEVHARVAGTMVVTTVVQVFENPLTEPTDAVYVFPLGAHAAISAYRIVIGARTIEGGSSAVEARATYDAPDRRPHRGAARAGDRQRVPQPRQLAPATIEVLSVSEPLACAPAARAGVLLTVGRATCRRPARAVPVGDPGCRRRDLGRLRRRRDRRQYRQLHCRARPAGGGGRVSLSHLCRDPGAWPHHHPLAARDEPSNRDPSSASAPGQPRTLTVALSSAVATTGYALLTIVPPLGSRRRAHPREVTIRRSLRLMADGGLAQAQAVARAGRGCRSPYPQRAGVRRRHPRFATPVASASGPRRRARFIDGLVAGGGTPLARGVLDALDEPVAPGRIRAVYVISDGLVGDDDVVVDAARGALGGNRVYPIGIGAAPNRYLLDALARVGRGFATYVGLTELWQIAPTWSLARARPTSPTFTSTGAGCGHRPGARSCPTSTPAAPDRRDPLRAAGHGTVMSAQPRRSPGHLPRVALPACADSRRCLAPPGPGRAAGRRRGHVMLPGGERDRGDRPATGW
jgi:Ca-activated chloride channel family protein